MNKVAMISLSVAMLASSSAFSNAFAEAPTAPLTRAQVYADLVRVEQAGYNPALSSDATYPAGIQAAEARVAAQGGDRMANDAANAQSAGMGAPMSGSTASGARGPMKGMSGSGTCVGPVSFCTPFFGS